MKYIVFSPHQDDELLTLGVPALRAMSKGFDPYVVLCTDGSASRVRRMLGDGTFCEYCNDEHRYNLTKPDFAAARDVEFRESCLALGYPNRNIIMPNTRQVDGCLKRSATQHFIKKVLASLVSHEEEFVVATISPYVLHQHQDHRTLGKSVLEIAKKGSYPLMKVQLFCEPYGYGKKYRKCIERHDERNSSKIRNAAKSYCTWKPENSRYAIGYHSVPSKFQDFLREQTAYEDEGWKSRFSIIPRMALYGEAFVRYSRSIMSNHN